MNLLVDICVPLTIILLFNIPAVKSQATFAISTSAKVGDPIQFLCSATYSVQYNVNFQHNSKNVLIAQVATPGNDKVKNTDGTSVVAINSTVYYRYNMNSLSCSNRGTYWCTVVTDASNPSESNKVELKVLGPPDNPNLTAPSANQVLGDNVTVYCESNVGSPALNLNLCIGSSSKNLLQCAPQDQAVELVDQCIFTRNQNLTFQVTKDTVYVSCIVGKSELKSVQTWEIDHPIDSIMIIPDVDKWQLTRGDTVEFKCQAYGIPDPSYMWEFFPRDFQSSKLTMNNIVVLDPNYSGVYVCTANNTVGGINYNMTKKLTVTVVEPTTRPPQPLPTTGTTSKTTIDSTLRMPTSAPSSSDTKTIVIGVLVPLVIIIIIVIIAIILYKRRVKPAEIEEPPEKPRNNHSEVNMMDTKPDLVHSTGMDKKIPMYNNDGFDLGNEDYTDLAFDDKPRSRKPIVSLRSSNIYDTTLPCV